MEMARVRMCFVLVLLSELGLLEALIVEVGLTDAADTLALPDVTEDGQVGIGSTGRKMEDLCPPCDVGECVRYTIVLPVRARGVLVGMGVTNMTV